MLSRKTHNENPPSTNQLLKNNVGLSSSKVKWFDAVRTVTQLSQVRRQHCFIRELARNERRTSSPIRAPHRIVPSFHRFPVSVRRVKLIGNVLRRTARVVSLASDWSPVISNDSLLIILSHNESRKRCKSFAKRKETQPNSPLSEWIFLSFSWTNRCFSRRRCLDCDQHSCVGRLDRIRIGLFLCVCLVLHRRIGVGLLSKKCQL